MTSKLATRLRTPRPPDQLVPATGQATTRQVPHATVHWSVDRGPRAAQSWVPPRRQIAAADHGGPPDSCCRRPPKAVPQAERDQSRPRDGRAMARRPTTTPHARLPLPQSPRQEIADQNSPAIPTPPPGPPLHPATARPAHADRPFPGPGGGAGDHWVAAWNWAEPERRVKQGSWAAAAWASWVKITKAVQVVLKMRANLTVSRIPGMSIPRARLSLVRSLCGVLFP